MNKLFFGVCVPFRLSLAFAAYYFKDSIKDQRLVLAIISLLIALGFIYNDSINKKGYFGSDRYWSGTIHAVFYLMFASMLYVLPEYAWTLLLADVIYGSVVVLIHYRKENKKIV